MDLSASSDSNDQDPGSQRLIWQPNASLISSDYRKLQEKLHEDEHYGVAGAAYAQPVAMLIREKGITHLLDYGCGHNLSLAKALNGLPEGLRVPHHFAYQAYDPGVPKYASEPVAADLVACIDVLEHIEPECIVSVLDHIAHLTVAYFFATIDTGPAKKVLPDGRNAHILQRPLAWWFELLDQRFVVENIVRTSEHSFLFIGSAKTQIQGTDGKLLT